MVSSDLGKLEVNRQLTVGKSPDAAALAASSANTVAGTAAKATVLAAACLKNERRSMVSPLAKLTGVRRKALFTLIR